MKYHVVKYEVIFKVGSQFLLYSLISSLAFYKLGQNFSGMVVRLSDDC